MLSRRAFVVRSLLAAPLAGLAQAPAPTTRPNIAQIDRLRILAAAEHTLTSPPVPDHSLDGPGWLAFTLGVPALAAASAIDPDKATLYADAAGRQLETWLLKAATRPVLTLETFQQLVALAPLAEIAVALPFLALPPALAARLKRTLAGYLKFLTEDTTALLARDAKDHHQSSWLLQVAALARYTGDDAALTDARHRFRTQVIRAQINAAGHFQHELTGEYPYRDSLWNLDMLAGACVLLTTRFESAWDYELQDGPGMRAAIAYHVPFIRNKLSWPYRADLDHFKDLPGRRPALVFAGRAYSQPDYVELWRVLNPDPAEPVILRTFPIRQPLLWLTQPRHEASQP